MSPCYTTALMAAQALYRRWRPQTFADVVGQEHVTQTLQNAVATDRLAHAYLFTGVRGTGKTSVARILAKAVNCTGDGVKPCNACAMCRAITEGRALDLIEIDAASNTGVDDVRDLREKIGFSPNEAQYKVYIVDEVHMLSNAAFNALLKTLEEPPAHAIFILATTEPHKIPDTIASRCQRHDFRRVSVRDLAGKLARICAAEDITADPEALAFVARAATGSLRDAESLLDQLIGSGETITVERVRAVLGTPGEEAVVGLVDAILAGDAAQGLRLINGALDHGADPRQLQNELLDYLRGLMLLQSGMDPVLLDEPADRLAAMQAQAARLPQPTLLAAIHRFNDARPSADRTQPGLPLELALVETVMGIAGGAEDRTTPLAASAAAIRPPVSLPAPPTAHPAGASPAAATMPPADSPRAAATARPAGSPPAASTNNAASADIATNIANRTAAKPEVESDIENEPVTSPPPKRDSVRTSSPTGTQTLAQILDQWPAVLAAVAAGDKNVAALMKDCRPVAADADSVTLGFFYAFHCQRMSEPNRAAVVAAALERVTGMARSVQCTVVAAGTADEHARPRTKSDQAKTDPVVKHALDNMGARIAGVQSMDWGEDTTS